MLGVMMFAALMQSLGGFGFALLAVPLCALVVDLKVAVIAVCVGSLFNSMMTFVRTRHEINRELAWRFNLPAVIGMPIGLYVLANVAQRPLKTVLGAVIILATLALMRGAANITPRRSIEVLAGWLAGILSTATGTNGPPLVLAAQMRGLAPEAFRATLALTFVLSGSFSLALYVAAGLVTTTSLTLAFAAVPLIVIGQRAGIRLQRHLHGRHFDRLVYGLLLLSGTSVGLSGLIG